MNCNTEQIANKAIELFRHCDTDEGWFKRNLMKYISSLPSTGMSGTQMSSTSTGKSAEPVEKLCTAIQNLFDYKKVNGNKNNSQMQNIWNRVAVNLGDVKQWLSKQQSSPLPLKSEEEILAIAAIELGLKYNVRNEIENAREYGFILGYEKAMHTFQGQPQQYEEGDTDASRVAFYRGQTEKIRKWLSENRIGKPNQGLFDAILEYLQSPAPATGMRDWIKVEKRPKSGYYLVFDPSYENENERIRKLWYSQVMNTWETMGIIFHPTHYQFLPQPPSTETK